MADPDSTSTGGKATAREARREAVRAWLAARRGDGSAWARAAEVEAVRFLAAGEYNENWLVLANGERFVFRVNHGSQLGLGRRQIAYEFSVLSALEGSDVTPEPFAVEPEPGGELGRGGGVLLMEYLPGRAFDYERDWRLAARVFARVHARPLPAEGEGGAEAGLIAQPDPVRAIAAESLSLLKRFADHPLAAERDRLLRYHDEILRLADETAPLFAAEPQVLVNTEVNSGNFIVDDHGGGGEGEGRAWLVDWEKAVVSTRYQDLGHFLAPTTTRWRTDFSFSPEARRAFLKCYKSEAGLAEPLSEIEAKAAVMERTILLRALSWCHMAHYEYSRPGRPLSSEMTFRRIQEYLGDIDGVLAASAAAETGLPGKR
ncbi:aminoglycoside phosphotransferase [Desulfovibrio sp. X2]|uniref:phosphotransferase family protein n=1 Tax=Desulfovibrio sp. X2 TaxID=941449 RepID=UPI000358B4B0|nr:aminoglycoside phosphotransferase family protein [Desulfovibrio sp. X2]EPR37398.1 aminoglycoside phosphotransferase [Desulfovibrio sp. X2]